MHLAIAKLLEDEIPIKDKNRFSVGHILPDAVINADKKDVGSHFIENFDQNTKKHFDFYAFYERYKSKLLSDELYLGYYFHLIEDDLFRRFLYYELDLLSKRGDPIMLEELYRDYHILNGIIVKEYALENTLCVPKGFEIEIINDIYPFDLQEFIDIIRSDFEENISGIPKRITKKRTDRFIQNCVCACKAEYTALKSGKHHLNRYDCYWDI